MDNKKYEIHTYDTPHEGFKIEVGMSKGTIQLEDVEELLATLTRLQANMAAVYTLMVVKRDKKVPKNLSPLAN